MPFSKLLTDMPQVKINKDDRVLIVSFKLPVQLERDDKGGLYVKKKGSIMNTTLYDLQNKKTLITAQWIGHPGIFPTTEGEFGNRTVPSSLQLCAGLAASQTALPSVVVPRKSDKTPFPQL